MFQIPLNLVEPIFHTFTGEMFSHFPYFVRPAGFIFGGSLVTLVVDWQFLRQNFGQVVGTYEGLLLLCECRCGGDCTFRWWGHLNITCHNRTCLNFLH